MGIIDFVNEEKESLQNTITLCQRELRHLPKGTLSTRTVNGKDYFRVYSDGQLINLNRSDTNLIKYKERKLAQMVFDNAQSNYTLVENLLKNYSVWDPNIILKELGDYYLDIPSSFINDLGYPDYRQFIDKPASTFYPEHLTETDDDGSLKRSKTELAISMLYKQKGLICEYEKEIILPDGYRFAPDFTVWSATEQRYKLHDHCGMMSKYDYYRDFEKKFHECIKNGLYPYRDILFTFSDQDGNLDLQTISKLIDLFMW